MTRRKLIVPNIQIVNQEIIYKLLHHGHREEEQNKSKPSRKIKMIKIRTKVN